MFLDQFVAYFGAASQTMFVMLAYSALIMHLLGVQDDLQQASEGGQTHQRLFMLFNKKLL